MGVVYVLWQRELKRYFRSRTQIIAALGSPLLYLLVLGFGLGPVFEEAGRGSYLQFVAPGVVGMAVLFAAFFAGFSVLFDRQFGFLKETLVAPVSRLQILAGKALGGATTAVIQGSVVLVACIVAGFRPHHATGIVVALVFMAGIAVVFSAIGTALGAVMRNLQSFQLLINFVVMPTFFLSGGLFPLTQLPAPLTALTRIDPLSYGVDGLRGALTTTSHFGLWVDLTVLLVAALFALTAGARSFSRIQA
jgi:ABC-2 type transport system permease protein